MRSKSPFERSDALEDPIVPDQSAIASSSTVIQTETVIP